jgi:hypothetical protein
LFVQARSDSFRKAASIATQGHRAPFRGQFNKKPLRRVADLSVARMTQEGINRLVIHRPPLRLAGFLIQMSE